MLIGKNKVNWCIKKRESIKKRERWRANKGMWYFNVHALISLLWQSFGLYCVNVLEDVVHINEIRFVKQCAREVNHSKRASCRSASWDQMALDWPPKFVWPWARNFGSFWAPVFMCDSREGMYSPCSGYENCMRRCMLACFLRSLWCTVVDWTTESLTFSEVIACILVKLHFSFLVPLLSCVYLLELCRENSSEPFSAWSITKFQDSRNCAFTILSLASGTLSMLGNAGARCIDGRMNDIGWISHLTTRETRRKP